MARGTLDALVVPIASALGEIAAILGIDSGADLIAELGYKLPDGSDLPALFSDVATSATRLSNALTIVVGAYADHSFEQPSFLQKVADLAAAVVDMATTADGLPQRAQAAIPDPAFLQNAKIDELPQRLVDFLLVGYLRRQQPLFESVLTLLGVVTQNPVPEGTYNPYYEKIEIRWDRIPKWFTDPKAVLAEEYGWARDPFRAEELLERLNAFMWLSGVYGLLLPVPDLDEDAPAPLQLDLPIFRSAIETPAGLAGVLMGLHVRRFDDPADATNSGLAVEPYIDGSFEQAIELRPGWRFVVDAKLAAEGFALTIQPAGANIRTAAGAAAAIRIGFERDGTVIGPLLLLGDTTATRLEIEQLQLMLFAAASTAGPLDVGVELATHGFRLVVQASDGDGFLQSVLPKDPLSIDFDFTIGASLLRGIYFSGGAGFEYTFHVNASLGPIFIDDIALGFKPDPTGAALSVSATGGLEIGPVVATVQEIGIKLAAALGQRGNLGNADLQVQFKPPTGLGLAIDASVVSGGGFLSLDFENQQYSGILQLSIQDIVDVKAIGILNARLPDGRPGYSLLLIITGEFPPIQLGMGFTLNGVGGLIAINRTVVVDVLRAGVRDGGLDAILFPPDPLSHVASLLGTLSAVFPVAENRYVFGPMVRIGWGSPTLITLDLALILEIPDPVRLIILGRLRAVLPNEQAPVVQLRLDAIGVLDFSRNEFSLDATLYDSRIVTFALTGDMALRLSWGSQPAFAMALGGFHPAFKPPPGFPALRRLALALSTGDNPRLRMESYFALTSNTVQVGARLELYVKIAAFSLEGGLGFDTLIQFSPFRLLADIDAHLALKRGSTTLMGLDINVHLMGPAPWVLWGQAKFKIFFVSFSIPFRATFGQSQDVPPIERREVWPILRDSLTATANWSARLPADSGRLVALRAGAGGDDLLAHPLGTLAVSQNLVPLDRTLGLFGAVPPKDFDRFAIVAATGLDIIDTTTQYFAPAQFRQMTDAEKLASPSFERMVSGARFAPHTAIAIGHVQDTPLDYEQAVILDVDQPASERLDQRYAPAGATVAVLAEHGPAGTAAVRTQGRAKFAPPAPGPKVADPSYVIVTRDDLTPVTVDGLDGSYTSAAERLRQRADRDALQIVRTEELELT